MTLGGGHTYLILEDDTLVYEYKTDLYKGQKNDKIFLDEEGNDVIISDDVFIKHLIFQSLEMGKKTDKGFYCTTRT